MYYYTYNTHILAAAGIVGILVIAVVLTALLAVLVLPKHKDGKLPAFFQLLFDAFTPKTLLLEKIAEVEHIEITEDDVNGEYDRLVKDYGMELDKVKSIVPVEEIKRQLTIQKAAKVITDSAEVTQL